jgi:hypothetical protein
MFQLTETEYQFLRSQFVTLNEEENKDQRGKHSKYLPYAFTEQGIAMLSGLLNSDIAEELLKDINDLSEYTRNNLDDIYIALTELADKHKKVTEVAEKSLKPIGYQHYNY